MHTTTGRRHRAATAGRRAAAMIATVGLVLIGAVATPAAAVESDSAEAEGRVVSGGGTVNLDGIASLAPAYSADPSAPGIVASPLQASVLSTLGIDLGGGVQLFGPNGVIGVGALEQYASTSEEDAYAASGAVTQDGSIAVGGTGPQDNAFVDVTELLDTAALSAITTGLISELRVELGALSATAGSVGDDLATSDYQIADGTLVFTSPVVQNLTTNLNGALTTLTTTANGITGPTGILGQALPGIATSVVGPLTTALRTVTAGLVTVSNVAVTVGLTVNLNTALSAITAAPITSTDSAVTINFATGEVTVDLARLIANSQGGPYDGTLNNLAPNTELLDPSLIQAGLDGAVATIFDQVPALLVSSANNTLRSSTMTVRLTANATVGTPPLAVPLVAVNVLATGTVASFLGTPGAPAPVLDTSQTTALGVIPLGTLLTPITSTVVGTLLPAIVTPLSNAITGVGITDAAFRPLVVAAGTALQPITGVINQILSITANVQEAGSFTTPAGFDEGAFTQRAVSIDLLPLLGTPLAEVNLASATVRSAVIPAVDVAITAPLDGDVLTVPDSGATLPLAVTGTGEIGADVSVAAPGLPTQTTVVGPDGTWTVTFPAAGVGTYAVTATQTAGAEVSTASVGVSVEVGEIDDVVITAPADGTVLTVPVDGTTDVVVSGTGQIGADVVVSLLGQPDQTVVVGPDGTWTATFAGIDEGSYAVTATQAVGDQTSSSSVTVVVDEVLPVAITLPTDGTVLTVPATAPETDVTVTGTGDPGADVVVTLSGLPEQTVTVAPDRTWTATFPGVGVGTYTVTAAQTVGDQATTASVGLTVEVGEITDVTITLPADGATLTVPDGASTLDVAVTGTGQIGAEVVVSAPGLADQTATVGPDGTWTVTFPAVGTGTYTATASQTVGAETTTATVGFTVEVGEIDDVAITTPTDGQVFTVAVGDETDVVVTGTGQIGAEVVVAVTGQDDQTVTVGPDGTWTATYRDLPAGEYTVTATQTVGTEQSTATVALEVAEIDAVAITAPSDGDVITVVTGETTDLVVSGTGFVGAGVLVSIPGQPEQPTTVGPDGTWTATFPGLGAGSYTVTADQTVGDQSSSSSVTVEVAEADAVTITAPADGTVVTVPAGGTTDLVVTGTADPATDVVVSIPGETDQTAVVAPDGSWTVTFPGLGEGTYAVTATQTVGTLTTDATVGVVVDDVAEVTVTAPAAGDVITVPIGGTADLDIVGTGDPGAEVLVTVTGQPDQTVVVEPDGSWTATFPGLGAGSYDVVATQTVGDQTTSVTVPVEVFEVAPLAITSPLDGDSLYVATGSEADLVVTGTGSVGADVLVSVPGETDQETTVGDEGTWTVTFPGLPAGTYTATATQLVGDQLSSEDVTVEVVDVDQVAITAPADGDVVSIPAGETTDVVVTGTGDAGADVVVSVTGQPDQTVTVETDGTWTATFPGLVEGAYTVTASQTVGTDVTASTVTVTVDAVDQVAILAPADGDEIPVAEGTTRDVVVSGTGDIGADVAVTVDGQPGQTVVVAPDGTWTATFTDLGAGTYEAMATQTVGGQTSTSTVTVELVDFVAVTITAPLDGDVILVLPGGSTDLVVSGAGETGSDVLVSIPGVGDQTVAVGPDGTWTATFDDVPVGEHEVTATQVVGDQTTDAAVTVSVEAEEVDAVAITAPADGDVISVEAGGTTDLVVEGTGDVGAEVVVSVTTQPDQTVTVGPDGTWTATFPGLGEGEAPYVVTATQTVGTDVTTSTVDVTVDGVDPVAITAPADGAVYSVPVGGSTALTVTGTGDVGADVLVSLAGQPDQTAVVGAGGTWTVTFTGLPVGEHDVVASQLVGGVTSTAEISVSVVVGTIGPVQILTPTSGDVITVPLGGSTDLVVSGTAQIGGEVVVTIPGEEPQTATVGDDGTWTVTFPGLGEGVHPITATQTAAGQVNQAAITVEVDGIVPVTVVEPADGDVVTVPVGGTTDLVVTGAGDPGAQVLVTVTGQVDQTVVVAPDGTWTATFSGLGAGAYDVTVAQTVGDQSTTETVSVEIDEVVAATITAPDDGDVVTVPVGGTTDLETAGTGDPGAEVEVSVTDQTPQTVTVQPDGTWTAVFPGLGEGTYDVTATQTVGDQTTTETVTVEVDGVVAATITAPTDGDVITVPEGGTTDLIVTGTGDPGAEVVVTVEGQAPQTVVVAPDGTWTATFPELPADSYEITVTQTVGDQTTTETVTVEVDGVVPASITAPVDGGTLQVPVGGTTDLVASGTGDPGADVVVSVTGQPDQTVVVAPDGTWTATFPGLGEGGYDVTATQTVGDQTTTETVTVTVDGVDAVSITAPLDGGVLYVADGGTTDLVVAGTGDAGAEVVVSVTGQPDQTVTVETDGTWTATFPGLGAGEYTVTADQTVGTVVSTTGVSVAVQVAAPVAITAPLDDAVFSIPTGGSTDLVVTGSGAAGASIVASISGQPDQTTTVNPEGTWTVTFPGLGVGSYDVTVGQLAGAVPSTDEVSVSVEVGSIAQVVILAPLSGDVVTVPVGGTTDLVVSGTGEIGGEVVVTVPGETPQTATVGPDGSWTVTFPGLGEGEHVVTATQTADGQTNQAAATVEVDAVVPVDITAPGDDTIITVLPGTAADLVLTGSGDVGAQVLVSVEGEDDQTVVVGPDGTWTATFPGLGAGSYDITASQTVGDQTSTDSITVEVQVDIDAAEVDPVTITLPADGDVLTVPDDASLLDVTVVGSGEAGAEVVVTVPGQEPQTATVGTDGTWTVTFPELGVGAYQVTATQTIEVSFTTDTVGVTIAVGEIVPVVITSPQDGSSIWVLPGATSELVVEGEGQIGADVVVSVTGQDDQPTTVGPDGTWTVTFEALAVGAYEVEAVQTVGDVESSDAVGVTVEAMEVADVVITSPLDGDVITVPAGEATDVVVTGAGQPDAEVVVSVPGWDDQTVTVSPEGTWEATLPEVGVGAYPVTATQTVGDQTSTDTAAFVVEAQDVPAGRPFAVVKYSLLVRGAGMTQEVYGSGFVPGETVSGVVRSTPLPLEPVVADAEGNVTLTFPVDEAFDLGAHAVYLTGSVSGELGADQLATGFVVMDMADGFLVTPGGSVIRWPGASAPALTGAGSSGGLARTGADDLGAGLLAGALLLLTGAGLLAVRRRTGEG